MHHPTPGEPPDSDPRWQPTMPLSASSGFFRAKNLTPGTYGGLPHAPKTPASAISLSISIDLFDREFDPRRIQPDQPGYMGMRHDRFVGPTVMVDDLTPFRPHDQVVPDAGHPEVIPTAQSPDSSRSRHAFDNSGFCRLLESRDFRPLV